MTNAYLVTPPTIRAIFAPDSGNREVRYLTEAEQQAFAGAGEDALIYERETEGATYLHDPETDELCAIDAEGNCWVEPWPGCTEWQ